MEDKKNQDKIRARASRTQIWQGEVVRQLDFDCVCHVKTVWTVVKGNAKAISMLQDPLLTIATKEIYSEGKTRAEALTSSRIDDDSLSMSYL